MYRLVLVNPFKPGLVIAPGLPVPLTFNLLSSPADPAPIGEAGAESRAITSNEDFTATSSFELLIAADFSSDRDHESIVSLKRWSSSTTERSEIVLLLKK
jgi:hypothetical protein